MTRPKIHKYMRRLGECMIAFDPETWQTFVLPAASTVIADLIMELAPDGRLSIDDLTEALRSELEVDLDSDRVRQVIEILRSAQVLDILQTEEHQQSPAGPVPVNVTLADLLPVS